MAYGKTHNLREFWRELFRSSVKDIREECESIFDQNFYLATNPDIAEGGVDPLAHFLEFGWREGRDPAPNFSLSFYAETYPEVARAGVNPLVHYLRKGRAAGFQTCPSTDVSKMSAEQWATVKAAFDAEYYLRSNPDVVTNGVDPFRHFISIGWREGRDPSPHFSVTHYKKKYEDVRTTVCNPFTHWVLHGGADGGAGSGAREVDESLIDWNSYDPAELEAITGKFDAAFYLAEYPAVADLGVDPAVHYLTVGWLKGYDPSPVFSTRFYCERYADIRRSGQNPFAHYCDYGREELRETESYLTRARRDFRPLVSVIVPNYNHSLYLRERIESIARQTYDNLEYIILDDNSTDNSREVIQEVVAELGIDAQLVFNTQNSGNVFAQWRQGLSRASGDVVWICESDDFCEPDFLEHLLPAFADESVNIAFGRIQFSDADGQFMEGLDGYRESAEEGIWNETLTRPASQWFNNGFGVNNLIANVGGCVFRRMELTDAIWEAAQSFKICGDWYLYIQLAGAGQVTYEPRSVAYFRQHGANTSASNFHHEYYYDEIVRVEAALVREWGIGLDTRHKFLGKVKAQYDQFRLADELGEFESRDDVKAVLRGGRKAMHVQLHFLGFHAGGGELFPINLANALLEAGITVSMLAQDMLSVNADMRARLDPRIPVYHTEHIVHYGRQSFFDAAGVSVINSHIANSDVFLADIDTAPIERPYMVTLHGSYVGLEVAPTEVMDWILANVSGWVFTADRNLEFFENREVDWDSFVNLPNAMPRDPRPAPFKREDLGIAPDDTVFTLIARGVKRKGWRAAVDAFRRLREDHGKSTAHLLLIGEGESTDEARALAGDLPGAHFLGYQSEINGILRLSDCLIMPTRFEGESYPLCLIQAIQESVPVIATDIGEIRSMMSEGGRVAGLLLENQRDSGAYFSQLTDAMVKMCDQDRRAAFSEIAAECARKFDMGELAKAYCKLYEQALQDF